MRFGLLGTGHWAEHTQGAALAGHPDVEFTGVWGRDPGKAAALADRLGTTGYSDVDALLADVEAVAFALPPDVQAPLAVRAARLGRHLLLEKPVALTVADADDVVEAVADAGVASLVFFTGRFDPAIAAALDLAASAGGWSSARVVMYGSIFTEDNPFGRSPWRREHGGLWDVGPHALSRLLPVLGPVVEVTAMAGAYSTSHVLLRHSGGAVSTMALTLDAPAAAVMGETQLHGVEGVVTLPGSSIDAVTAYQVAVDQLIAQAASGRPGHPADVVFGREVVAILAAAERSQREGHTVTLD